MIGSQFVSGHHCDARDLRYFRDEVASAIAAGCAAAFESAEVEAGISIPRISCSVAESAAPLKKWPLAKKLGVPVSPRCWPSSRSFLTAAAFAPESKHPSNFA